MKAQIYRLFIFVVGQKGDAAKIYSCFPSD
jgi:hypothetical protein